MSRVVRMGGEGWRGGTHAGDVPLLPEHGAAGVEEGFEVEHAGDGVGEEADEVREGDVRDAVG